MQVERRHALERHLGDDAERAEADAGDAQQIGSVSCRRTRTTSPLPVTSSIPTIVVARLPRPAPVPWVAVLIAPAIDWRVDVAEVGHRQADRGELVAEVAQADPAPATVTRPVAASTCSTAFIASSDSSTPSVIAAAVNECPAPMALTR